MPAVLGVLALSTRFCESVPNSLMVAVQMERFLPPFTVYSMTEQEKQ